MMLALPPVLGQLPATPAHSCGKTPAEGVALNAYSVTWKEEHAGWLHAARPTAQMMAVFGTVPLDDTEVKKPGSCTLVSSRGEEATRSSEGLPRLTVGAHVITRLFHWVGVVSGTGA